jgi:uncharacterized small protein (TIGR04563 family)
MRKYDQIIPREVPVIRTTISLPEEEFDEIKRLAERTDRSISWLLRQAFRLARGRLERGEAYTATFNRVWADVGAALRGAGVKHKHVGQLIATVRSRRAKKKAGTKRR